MSDFKRLKRELMHKGSIINFYADTILLPDGREVIWDHVEHDGAAAVIAVNKDNKILLVRQYRNALDRYTLEIPAGGVLSKEEPTRLCAARELEEETGYKAGTVEFLIRLKTAVAFTNENIDVYIAKDLVRTEQKLDPDEFITIEAYDIEELINMVYKGELQDAKTVSSLFAYYYREKRI